MFHKGLWVVQGRLPKFAGVYSCRMFVCFSGATMMATNVQKIVVGATKAHWLGSYVQVDDKLYLGLYHIRMKICSNALKKCDVMWCVGKDAMRQHHWVMLKVFFPEVRTKSIDAEGLVAKCSFKRGFVESHCEISFLNHENKNHIFQSFNDIWNSFNYTSWNACDFQMVWWERNSQFRGK